METADFPKHEKPYLQRVLANLGQMLKQQFELKLLLRLIIQGTLTGLKPAIPTRKSFFATLENVFSYKKNVFATLENNFSYRKSFFATLENVFSYKKNVFATLENNFSYRKSFFATLENNFSYKKNVFATLENVFSYRKSFFATLESGFYGGMFSNLEEVKYLQKPLHTTTNSEGVVQKPIINRKGWVPLHHSNTPPQYLQ